MQQFSEIERQYSRFIVFSSSFFRYSLPTTSLKPPGGPSTLQLNSQTDEFKEVLMVLTCGCRTAITAVWAGYIWFQTTRKGFADVL